MINQIYHTSHCGSTLLAHLISYSTRTYTEPDWCFGYVGGVCDNKLHEYDNIECIKLPSWMCNVAKHNHGKKIFLYRKLQDHLHYMHDKGHVYLIYPGETTEYTILNLHHSLIPFIELCDTDLKKFCLFWADNFLHMKDSKEVLYIESNHFFNNREDVVADVLNHFLIKEGKTDYSRIDAKYFIKDNMIVPVSDKFGVVDRINTPEEVKEAVAWFKNIFGEELKDFF